MYGAVLFLVSFVPWVVYWMLSGDGNRAGSLIALVVSVILLIPQILKKDYSLLDLTAVLYFFVAVISTLILNQNVFVYGDGYLGYFAIFLAALFSLVFKKPLTLYYMKRDFRGIDLRDRAFIALNKFVTTVWVGVLLIDTIIYFVLTPFQAAVPALVLSSAFNAAGIVVQIMASRGKWREKTEKYGECKSV